MFLTHVSCITLILFNVKVFLNAQRQIDTPPSTLSVQFLLTKNKKKDTKFEYNPNYGYEPYWADGDWVLTSTTTTKPPPLKPGETTTSKPELVCGHPCGESYRKIKKICARVVSTIEFTGCTDYKCSGNDAVGIYSGFQTIDTYCKFLDKKCRIKFHSKDRLVLLYFGACKNWKEFFKPMRDFVDIEDRKNKYIKAYKSKTWSPTIPTTTNATKTAA